MKGAGPTGQAAGGRDEEPIVNKKNTEPQAARACFGRLGGDTRFRWHRFNG